MNLTQPSGQTRPRKPLAPLLAAVLTLSACATVPEGSESENDPWQSFNRSMFEVNRFGDKIIYKPFGQAYKKVVPSFARKGVNNFFDNLRTPSSSLNNFLQGKPGRGFSELARFMFNSTLGIGGLFDVAAAGDLQRFDEDFAQTLAVWGIPGRPVCCRASLGSADSSQCCRTAGGFRNGFAAPDGRYRHA